MSVEAMISKGFGCSLESSEMLSFWAYKEILKGIHTETQK